jgi:histidine triad (HIT) family protein
MNMTLDEVRAKSKKSGCVFCDHSKIQAANIEGYQLKGFDFLSFTPLNPITQGHLVVIPVIHVNDASAEPVITGATFELAAMIADDLGYEDYNLIVNKGANADQTVFHLHVHIVPRYKNDDTITIWNKQGALDKDVGRERERVYLFNQNKRGYS